MASLVISMALVACQSSKSTTAAFPKPALPCPCELSPLSSPSSVRYFGGSLSVTKSGQNGVSFALQHQEPTVMRAKDPRWRRETHLNGVILAVNWIPAKTVRRLKAGQWEYRFPRRVFCFSRTVRCSAILTTKNVAIIAAPICRQIPVSGPRYL